MIRRGRPDVEHLPGALQVGRLHGEHQAVQQHGRGRLQRLGQSGAVGRPARALRAQHVGGAESLSLRGHVRGGKRPHSRPLGDAVSRLVASGRAIQGADLLGDESGRRVGRLARRTVFCGSTATSCRRRRRSRRWRSGRRWRRRACSTTKRL